jgi:hypothetical protein
LAGCIARRSASWTTRQSSESQQTVM